MKYLKNTHNLSCKFPYKRGFFIQENSLFLCLVRLVTLLLLVDCVTMLNTAYCSTNTSTNCSAHGRASQSTHRTSQCSTYCSTDQCSCSNTIPSTPNNCISSRVVTTRSNLLCYSEGSLRTSGIDRTYNSSRLSTKEEYRLTNIFNTYILVQGFRYFSYIIIYGRVNCLLHSMSVSSTYLY